MIKRINLKEIPPAIEGHTLPIKNLPIIICHGYDSPYGHFAFIKGRCPHVHDFRFGLNFKVPIETFIYASKEGTVVHNEESLEKVYFGLDPEKGFKIFTNKILIKHTDNSYALYSNIQKDCSFVWVGRKVEKGQEIGLTGLSGWVGTTPNLHYMLLDETLTKTLPVKFEDYNGPYFHKDLINSQKDI